MAQSAADPNIRISQIYTRGGEAGATFQNDFVELFNRGNTDVDISGWSLNISTRKTPPQISQIQTTRLRRLMCGSAPRFRLAFIMIRGYAPATGHSPI